MGASFICLNYRSQNPISTPPSKWPKKATAAQEAHLSVCMCVTQLKDSTSS